MNGRFATEKNRWIALVFISLGLAIVVIDNTVLNVAIPYILRDLKTTFDAVQWVVSGYALIIATVLITVGRLGDLYGRKKIFILGAILFAIGSYIASVSQTARILFVGEALIEAIGAAMMMTTSLALLVSEFHGKERAIAFGIWGSVAGASATVGPLLGGYLTTYYSWRWSLRINVIVALIAIIGSIFVKESKGSAAKYFDWMGVILSGAGLFSLVFGFIEGQKFGWWKPNETFTAGYLTWNSKDISIIPFFFLLSIVFLILFAVNEYQAEKKQRSPLLKMSLFKSREFALGLISLGIISLGQFGVFFILPIFFQNALGLNALQTGIVFLFASISVIIFGPLSGFLASNIGPKWIVNLGMIILGFGTLFLSHTISTTSTGYSLAPGLVLIGTGVGMSSAQLTNIILSGVSVQYAGEASAANSAIRQVGTSIGIAILGVILANALTTKIPAYIKADTNIPNFFKVQIVERLAKVTPESRQSTSNQNFGPDQALVKHVKDDINQAFVDSSKIALDWATLFILAGAFASLFIPVEQTVKSPRGEQKQTEVANAQKAIAGRE